MSRHDEQLRQRSRLEETCRVFEDLRAYVASEPQLSEFLPAAVELEAQARQLAKGETDVPPLNAVPAASMPSKYFAERIIEMISRSPAAGHDFDDEAKLGLGRLLENLVIGVTGTIFSDFPEVVPREKAQ
jgi:hypothetical protein